MTDDQIVYFVNHKIQFDRPHYKLRAYQTYDNLWTSGSDGVAIEVFHDSEDSVHPGEPITVRNYRKIPRGTIRNRRQLVSKVRKIIRELDDHERDEWLRVDGELPYDPHRVAA